MSSPSPRRTLSRLRRKFDDSNESTNTLGSNDGDDDANGYQLSLRPTTSSGRGAKLKDRLRRKSVDERPDSPNSGRRLSTLIANKLKRSNSNDYLHNRSADSPKGSLMVSGNNSTSSLGLEDSGHSSLLTNDEDSDYGGKPVRPPLSTHNSHSGYLTLSAPDIESQIFPPPTDSPTPPSPDHFPISQSTSNIPQIVEPYDVEPLSAPITFDRSSSTPENFSHVFRLQQEKNSEDADSVKSAARGQESVNAAGGSIGQSGLLQERPVTPQRAGHPSVNTASRPETPPNLVETPTTYVTPPTPTDPTADAATFGGRASPPKHSPSRDSVRGRRINLPSKLSQSIPAPLTPAIEEVKTPGGTISQPTNATGFFSSVFTAAQKAADSLTSTLTPVGTASPKSRSVSEQSLARGGEEVIPGVESRSAQNGAEGVGRQSAIETLGSGDLTLSHLGISDSMGSSSHLPMSNGSLLAEEEAKKKLEEEAAARAVSEAYQEAVVPAIKEAAAARAGRPQSIASNERLTLAGDHTPPRPGLEGDPIKRSGSVRSKLSGRRRRRRGTSATAGTTGTTIVAGLAASASGLSNPNAHGTGHRLTGFAVASNKRNKDFHQLFRSVPEDDYLIEDYSAALQRDILLHGRLYVSEGHICFSSNILGWVTNLVISFDEVISVEKKNTAVIFPNAIVISTQQARNTFASFVARDSTYELLIGIWKINHPNLKSSLNGVSLDNQGTGDKTVVAEDGSDGESETDSEDEVYDEDADDDAGSLIDAATAPSIAGSDMGPERPPLSRQPSGNPIASAAPQATGTAVLKGLENSDAVVTGAGVSIDFPGPPTHEPTQCSDTADHYDKPLTDTTIPAPLGKIYSMMFGPASTTFMRKWHVEDQKSRDLNFADTPLDNDHKTITFDYIKPLSGSIGPKQTKCITTYNLITFDLEKCITVDCSTVNPDVPSGSVFSTKTRYCLMWGPDNSTRMIANSTVEWTGKSWIKGPIEKSANEGQMEFVKSLVAALKAAVSTKPPVKGAPKKGKRKGKKEVFDAEEADAQRDAAVAADQQDTNWGLFEPVHGILKPFINIISPFITSQTIIAVLFVLLVYTWINPPPAVSRRGSAGVGFPTTPQRLAAYEEMWRREESELWDWLEDRVGLEGVYAPSLGGVAKGERQRVLAARGMGKKIEEEGKMKDRFVDDAIRVTEEKLEALKEAVGRRKEEKVKVKGTGKV